MQFWITSKKWFWALLLLMYFLHTTLRSLRSRRPELSLPKTQIILCFMVWFGYVFITFQCVLGVFEFFPRFDQRNSLQQKLSPYFLCLLKPKHYQDRIIFVFFTSNQNIYKKLYIVWLYYEQHDNGSIVGRFNNSKRRNRSNRACKKPLAFLCSIFRVHGV